MGDHQNAGVCVAGFDRDVHVGTEWPYHPTVGRIITAVMWIGTPDSSVMSTQERSGGGAGSLTTLHWIAVALVVVTGALHVYAGLVEGRPPVTLAGVGYAGALVLFFLNYRRRLLYAIGIPYTAVQIPIWLVVKSEYGIVDYVDKAVQVVLIVVLAYLYLQSRGAAADTPATAAD
jgi:hypothetical protein